MKKLLGLGLALFLAVGLTACGDKSEGGAGEGKKVTIRVGHVEPEERSTHIALLKFKEKVEKDSNGEITVDIFSNGVLGGDEAMIESVSLGSLEITLPTSSALTSYDDRFGILDMPFLFDNYQNSFDAVDGKVGAELTKVIEENGYANLGWLYNGARSITNSSNPVNVPDDVKGLKIRVMNTPIFIDFFNALGANATPMSFGEVFTALQLGTVDGQENSPSLIYSSRYFEAQKYLSLTEHVHNFLPILTNKDFYNGLSDAHKKILDEAVIELVKNQRDLEVNDSDSFVKKLEDEGMKVNKISAENLEKFKKAVESVYEKNKGKIGQALFDLAAEYNK